MDNIETDLIIHGDNVETMKGFPEESIDLVVTSPPYDNLRTYGGHTWDFEGVAQQLWRVIKPGGVVVWVVADATVDGSETGTSFRQALRFKEIGFRLHDTMIYHTEKMPLTHNRYEQEFEYMFVLSKGRPYAFNPIKVKTKRSGDKIHYGSRPGSIRASASENSAMRHRPEINVVKDEKQYSNVWFVPSNFNKTTKDVVAYQHPAIFPEALARDHILSWSNEGDIVLDPFSGSGTTAKMAKHNGRRFIGIEVNKKYVEISEKRLAQKVLF